jgi:hypothetical protein
MDKPAKLILAGEVGGERNGFRAETLDLFDETFRLCA